MNAEESTPSRRRLLRGLALAPAAALGSTLAGCGLVGFPESAPAELPSDTTTTATSPSAQPASPAPAEPARPEAEALTIRWNGLDPGGQAAATDAQGGQRAVVAALDGGAHAPQRIDDPAHGTG